MRNLAIKSSLSQVKPVTASAFMIDWYAETSNRRTWVGTDAIIFVCLLLIRCNPRAVNYVNYSKSNEEFFFPNQRLVFRSPPEEKERERKRRVFRKSNKERGSVGNFR